MHRKLLLSVSVLFLVMAFFSAWEDQHRAYLNEAKENTPDLKATVYKSILAYNMDTGECCDVIILLGIRNLGSPSVARLWTVNLETASQKYNLRILKAPKTGKNLVNPNTKQVMQHLAASDLVTEKVGTNPIPKGGEANGYLWAHLDGGKKDDFNSDVAAIVSYEDVRGTRCIGRILMPARGSPESVPYIPGLSD